MRKYISSSMRRRVAGLVIWAMALVTCQLYWLPNVTAVRASAQNNNVTAEVGWPRELTKNGVRLVYYQPQIDEWKDYSEIEARMAVQLTPPGGQPAPGVASLHANTIADLEARSVVVRDITIVSSRFPSLDSAAADQMGQTLQQVFPTAAVTISLDRLIASVERSKTQVKPVAVKTDPPQILYSTSPAILLLVEGEPALAPIENTKLEFVVNTNWDLFFDKSAKSYYLLAGKTWQTAKALTGPWAAAYSLPNDFSKLPQNQNWDDIKQAMPPSAANGQPPQIFYSNTPSELIVFKGNPVFAKIPRTRLVYATNTESDVFMRTDQNQYYFLVSGRWFRARQLTGPWSYASNDLPNDFAAIPRNSPVAHVLSSVPGTQEASDAVMLAQIPTTAIINRAQAEARVKVSYDGQPNFQPIAGTQLEYATNTQDKIIKVGDLYYLCFQAVWFTSTTPQGPWKVAALVPDEIYTIPPSSPLYNLTYVTQSDPTTTTIESSYTSGYLGMFVVGAAVGAAVAWGTGYYYPPYIGWVGAYPIYRPYAYTYGASAVYNPYTGGYRLGSAAYGPYGGIGTSAWYNPATGRYGRAATVQTPYGGRTVAQAYNPWTGAYGATRQGSSPYGQWGSSVATRGNQWAQTAHVTNSQGTVAGYRTSSGQRGAVASGSRGTVAATNNNVYAGKDGNVYKRDSGGGWSQYNNGSWNQMQTPSRSQMSQNTQSAMSQRPAQTTGNGQAIGQRAGAQSGARTAMNPDTFQGLNQEAMGRQRGAQQSQLLQNKPSGGGDGLGSRLSGDGGGFGGGGFRGGGGGGGGFGGRRGGRRR